MLKKSTILAALLFALCNTTFAQSQTPPIKEQKTMQENTDGTQKLTQRQVLTKFLDVLAQVHSKDDFTFETVAKIWGNDSKSWFSGEEFGFSGPLSSNPNWKYFFAKLKNPTPNKPPSKLFGIELRFHQYQQTFPTDIVSICDMKLEEFTRRAESLGYTGSPLYHRNDRYPGVVLQRDKVLASVHTVGKAGSPEADCIEVIFIQTPI